MNDDGTSLVSTDMDDSSRMTPGKVVLMIAIPLSFLVVFMLAFFSVFTFSRVEGSSMEPTLFEGEQLLSMKALVINTFDRGDIVGFSTDKVSLNVKNGELVKRVIGLPGDLVEIKGRQVYINGIPLDEMYAIWNAQQLPPRGDNIPLDIYNLAIENCVTGRCNAGTVKAWRIPESHVFVLGDNRYGCLDSRSLGPIPIEDINNKVFLRYWPVRVAKLFGEYEYGN